MHWGAMAHKPLSSRAQDKSNAYGTFWELNKTHICCSKTAFKIFIANYL